MNFKPNKNMGYLFSILLKLWVLKITIKNHIGKNKIFKGMLGKKE